MRSKDLRALCLPIRKGQEMLWHSHRSATAKECFGRSQTQCRTPWGTLPVPLGADGSIVGGARPLGGLPQFNRLSKLAPPRVARALRTGDETHPQGDQSSDGIFEHAHRRVDNRSSNNNNKNSSSSSSSSRGSYSSSGPSNGTGSSRGRGGTTPPVRSSDASARAQPGMSRGRSNERASGAGTRPRRSYSAPAAYPAIGAPKRQLTRAGAKAAAAINKPLGIVVQVVEEYRASMEQGHIPTPAPPADIRVLCESLSTALGKAGGQRYLLQQQPQQRQACQAAAHWLYKQAMLVVQQSHGRMSSSTTGSKMPIQDLCALAYTLPGLGQALRSQASVLPLTHDIAEHAASYVQHGDAPPIVRSWCDLLYGLTKAGLVANTDSNASPEAVKQHSPHLQHLLDVAAQQLPALLCNQGAVAQDVSLTLLAYAYAGYTGDLGPVTQALASNLEGCLWAPKPQDAANILWALGKLCEMGQQEHQQWVVTAPSCSSQALFSYCLGALHRQLADAKSQDLSNAVYGCALAGHVEGVPQLLDWVCEQPQVMAQANPQSWSNTIWAAAKVGCMQQGAVLLRRLTDQPQVLVRALPQAWSNTLWGCATMHEAAAGQDNQGNLASELKHSGQLLLGAVLQHQQALDNANTQVWSNTIWAAAKLGCVEQGSVLLQRLASQPQVLTAADPQSWSNTIWAAAKLGCVEQGSVLLTRLAGQPQVMQQAQPQGWSTTLWAAAKLGCVEQGSVLLERLARQPQILTAADPQSWSNNLWAAATLYQTAVATRAAVTEKLQEVGHLLFQACASSPTAMEGAKPQAWSNTLWAAAALRWYDQGLFAQGAAALAAMPPAELEPQHISNGLYACAVCAHWDDNVQQQLGRVGECDLSSFTGQALANTLYAWAVLSRVMTTFGAAQQHKGAWSSASQALFQEAVQRNVSSYVEQELGQLYVAQLHCQHLGIPGLPVGAVLEAARAVGWTLAELSTTAGQREVATVLQQLGYTTQLEMKSPDGVMSADVGVTALPDGCPCSIAVEFDGPHHFVADNSSATSSSRSNKTAAAVDRLEGPTRLRNALLQARFPDGVVCIPWKEWVAATKAGQQEEYLRAALAQVAGQQEAAGAPSAAKAAGNEDAGPPRSKNTGTQPRKQGRDATSNSSTRSSRARSKKSKVTAGGADDSWISAWQ